MGQNESSKTDSQDQLPTHLGLILDGNRRWAKQEGLPSLEGHKRGYENLKTICRAALNRQIKYISAYAFSTENWNRSAEEVSYLMKLLLWVAKNEVKDLHKDGIRVRFAGSRQRLSADILKAIDAAELKTKANKKGTLVLCINYGGHQEIADAFNGMQAAGVKAAQPADIEQYLYAADVPPIDLLIRTSGEQRLSNFMLWRAAYSELYFSPKFWPAFTAQDLDIALSDFINRQRRFGE